MRESKLFKRLDAVLGIPLVFLAGAIVRAFDSLRRETRSPRRLLLIKLSAVGDIVLLLPSIRAVRERYPEARIEFLCTAVNYQAVTLSESLDHIQTFDPAAFIRSPYLLKRFLTWLWSPPFDMVIDFDQWVRTTSLVTILSGARSRFGFESPGQWRHWAYRSPVPLQRGVHESENFRRLAVRAGARPFDPVPRLTLPETVQMKALRLRQPGRPLVAMHPGCGSTGRPREWPADHYVELATRLHREWNSQILLTGGPSERELVQRIARQVKGEVWVQCGRLPLTWFAALLSSADVVVCGNTGALHIAAAVGTPVVGLHGPTDPRKWGPLGDHHIVLTTDLTCSPCLFYGFEYGCGTYPCMARITVNDVYRAVVELLQCVSAPGVGPGGLE